jgi:hypothetical protein
VPVKRDMTFWCDEHIIVQMEGPGGTTDVVLPQPYARIGSHPQCDIVLPDSDVAKRALYLHATPSGIYCLNLDVPEGSVESPGFWLPADQVLVVGPYRLRARLASGAPAVPSVVVGLIERGSAAVPLPVLNVFCDRLLKDKRRLRAQLNLVGRRPQCPLRLRGHEVSSFHCALYWHDRRLWCIDLNSSNPTLLNGEAFDCREVVLHDQLDVGEFRLVYWRLSPRNWDQAGSPDTWLAQEDQPPIAVSAGGPFDAPAAAATLVVSEAGDSALSSLSGIDPATEVPGVAAEGLAGEVARLVQEREEHQKQWNETAQHMRQQYENLQLELARRSDEAARLAEEQAEQQRVWNEASQRIRLENQQIQGELTRLRGEHEALLQERQQWHSQCEQLQQQLAEHSKELVKLRAELAETIALLASSRVPVPGPSNGDLAAAHGAAPQGDSKVLPRQKTPLRATVAKGGKRWRDDSVSAAPLSLGEPPLDPTANESHASEAAEVEAVVVEAAPVESTRNAESSEPAATDVPALLPEEAPSSTAVVGSENPMPAFLPLATGQEAALPPALAFGEGWLVDKAASRGSSSRDGLSNFISDRLVDMQKRHRRRRVLLVWGAALAVVFTTVASALVAWQALS